MEGHVARVGEKRNVYNNFVRKPEWKERDHLEDLDIDEKIIREIVWEGVNWKHLARNRDQWRILVTMVMNFRFL